jgi:hypothetical protein
MLSIALVMAGTPAMAHPDTGVTDGPEEPSSSLPHLDSESDHPQGDPSAPLAERDSETADVVSSGPSAKVTKNLAVAGRGERLLADGTTDVWAHDGFAYLGTFNTPCGTGEGDDGQGLVQYPNGEGPGIAVFDVHNANKPSYVGNIPSVEGSRINDVKVFKAVDGRDLLVHSNEGCAGGPGGFRVYDVSDVTNAVLLAEVQTDDINVLLREQLDYTDFGVHNLYAFTQGGRQYVAAQVEGLLGNFQIFDLTDPANPVLVGAWGAEELLEGYEDVNWATTTDLDAIGAAEAWLFGGFGASQNRFLHDFWVAADGSIAYLANWDAGLVRLDISDLTNPVVVSVALDPTSEDGEVNSHSVWPTADGKTVIEGEEDFAPFKVQLSLPFAGIFDSAEASFTPPIGQTETSSFAGPTTYIGLGCDAGEVPQAPSADAVAVVQRGVCTFQLKVDNAADKGYAAVIIFNDAARGDALLTPSGDGADIPAIFVGHSTGLAIFGVDSAAALVIGDTGETATGESVADGWSGFRIWDYSDPANPVLASTFNTVCSANPLAEQCDPRGTYSSHNVIVDGTRAYISWYSDGVVVLDLSDPYAPVEVARYSESGPAFEAQNGGIQDVWGVYKEPGKPFIYASDRNGGLYVLKEYGAGSAKNGKAGTAGGVKGGKK